MYTKGMRKIDERRLKRKKILVVSSLIFIVICIILVCSLYIAQKGVRDWVDIHILGKNLTEDDTQIINLNTDKSNQIHVYSKYIAILNDKIVSLYNSYGEKVDEIKVDINTGIFDSDDKYFVVAEKQGDEVCLIFDKTYLWSENVEGEILQVEVNQNGYVAVVTEDVTHKSVLTFYNSEGEKLFTSYFASTRIIDLSISKDNKYVAIAEIDTTGTVVQSAVKIISAQNAQNDAENAITYVYNLNSENLITNVEYQANGQISYLYDNGISVIKNEKNEDIIKIENENIAFVANELKNSAVYIKEESAGLFKSESNVHMINTFNNQEKIYKLEEVAKELYTKNDIVAINTGTQIYFLDTNGWLIRKYTSKQEITNVEFSRNLAAIIYKDKVIIVSL